VLSVPNEYPHLAFVRQAFQEFDVQEGSLDDYYARFWVPDGVIEFVDGFPISGSYTGLENGRIKHLRVYVGHRRALDAARSGA
jgi:hypothetical protein